MHLLLECGADVNFCGRMSITAAAWGGQIDAAWILIKAGLREEQISGFAFLARAMCSMRPEAADFLRSFQESGLIDIYHLCKDPVDAKGRLAELVLYAAAMGHVKCLRIFQEYKVDFDDGPIYAQIELPSPVVVARSWSQEEVVEYLLSIGVKDIDPLDSCFAEHFRSGKLPTEPKPMYECKLPYRAF